ncbi:MAG: hypothetical protein LBF71_03555 [Campylobacteraceae bacterium]|jgi:hypothetical protein|nr:hypothetical protein [Campylobacteraceae bacterium]
MLLTGCGGGGSGTGSSTTSGTLEYTISFLDSNLDVAYSVTKPSKDYNITDIAVNELGITLPVYAADGIEVAGNIAYENYSLIQNVNFYIDVNDVAEITDQEGLSAIRDNLSGKYVLTKDINLTFDSDEGWLPIGNTGNRFTGIFNGNNHVITGLRINRPSTQFVGLFGYAVNTQIKNLGVEAADEIKGKEYIGGIAGIVRNSNIANSYFTGNISGNHIGGIAGYLHDSNITNSYFTGNIIGDTNNVGGIAANAYTNSYITNSYSTGNISVIHTSNNNFVGGIVGFIADNSFATNNAAINPSINGGQHTNRIVGCIQKPSATECMEDASAVTNNFALANIHGTFTDAGSEIYQGISKTIDDFKAESTYAVDLNWNFGDNATHPWTIDNNGVKNNGLPYFYWQDL